MTDSDRAVGMRPVITKPTPPNRVRVRTREYAHFERDDELYIRPVHDHEGPEDYVGSSFEEELLQLQFPAKHEPDYDLWHARTDVLVDYLGRVPCYCQLWGYPVFDDSWEVGDTFTREVLWSRFVDIYGPIDESDFPEVNCE